VIDATLKTLPEIGEWVNVGSKSTAFLGQIVEYRSAGYMNPWKQEYAAELAQHSIEVFAIVRVPNITEHMIVDAITLLR
jgi:hypothetical protein